MKKKSIKFCLKHFKKFYEKKITDLCIYRTFSSNAIFLCLNNEVLTSTSKRRHVFYRFFKMS